MPQYATNIEFLARYDWRWIAKNISDGSTIAGSNTPPTLSELQGSTGAGATLSTLLSVASEKVLSAAVIGKRYTPEEVATYGGELLKQIVSDLTVGLVLKRRVRASTSEEALARAAAEAEEFLEALRRGERIFYAVPNVPEAGLPGTGSMNPVPGINQPQITTLSGRYFGTAGFPRPWWN